MRSTDIDAPIASFTAGRWLASMGLLFDLAPGMSMNEPYIYQELGNLSLEPLQPGERKLIGAIFLFGLALLGALYFLQRWLPLGS